MKCEYGGVTEVKGWGEGLGSCLGLRNVGVLGNDVLEGVSCLRALRVVDELSQFAGVGGLAFGNARFNAPNLRTTNPNSNSKPSLLTVSPTPQLHDFEPRTRRQTCPAFSPVMAAEWTM